VEFIPENGGGGTVLHRGGARRAVDTMPPTRPVTDVVRASELQHSVQGAGREGNLGRLGLICARSKGIANHPFVSPDRRLDLRPVSCCRKLGPPQSPCKPMGHSGFKPL
jgi:hypothetical protein